MHFTNHVAVFIGLAAAAPTATPTKDNMIAVSTTAPSAYEDPYTYWAAGNHSFSTCDKKTYNAHQAPKSTKRANYRDCAALLSTFGTRNGTFSIPAASDDKREYDVGDGLVNIVKSGSCAFAVRADKGLKVGDDDVVWIMQKAVLEYSAGTEMAARGSVKCAADEVGKKGGLYWQVHGIESAGY
ncbi:hypothetical protein FPRO06_04087 [Fusarium proliferatum]|uniref:Ecp2 effector protein-like domain-containing protein n=1 Tax=Fusarium proliferatum (strain ET1) TaxID=1227346 RepID=A0A1L7V7K4_FUSPR|nr:uncharacterized protein FPRO_02929 [Fusarium proliferatum ET1]KAG4289265.1 hypothetical protein FPRO06_04087 [Fusarium proliferatum]KAI1054819.1 hypothetical protein LB506_006875 [Fusarium annulatum]CVL13186.1 uncharacterized protein FPRN_02811 [Fusarium proliferatum]CZR36811.1 uncharacterized protein FPRO_02929 [Fusarium proliferatum ET1]